jgi:protocatechuate 3,4-dioxygenase beta subunit
VIALLGFASAALAFGCGSDAEGNPTSPEGTTSVGSNASCAVTPTETIGPYPSHESLIRSDIRDGKSGTPLALTITVVSSSNNLRRGRRSKCRNLAVRRNWHYSEYGTQTTQTYLRGIQTTDPNGQVPFTTIYPGWYQGRGLTSMLRWFATVRR